MRKKPASAERVINGMSPAAIAKRFEKMIAVYATKTRLAWKLPDSAEEDLRGYGGVGLSEAIEKFDESLGFAFNTYAEHRVRGAIQNGAKALHHAKRIGASSLAMQRDADAGDKWDRIMDVLEDIAAGTAVAYASDPTTPEDHLLRQEQSDLVRDALTSLPSRRQDLLRWVFLEGAEGPEVADRLGVSKSRFCHLKSQALSQLFQRFSELEDPQRGT